MGAANLSALSTGFKTPEVPPFSRYQGILNRMPFGAAPAAAPAMINPIDAKTAAQAMKEQQLLARKINMSCVNITPAGTSAVGFTDLSVKPPVNYYLLVGDDSNGWTVLDANYEEEWAELEKDGTAIYVKLGEGLMVEPPGSKAVVAKAKKTNARNDKNALQDENEIAEKPKKPFKTATEQLLAMELSIPAGTASPPFPDLSTMQDEDTIKALEHKIVIEEDDNDRTLILKDDVALAKDELTVHILNEGGDTKSYLQRLKERREAEIARQQAERNAALEKLEELAQRITKEELEKQREVLNQQLLELGVEPLY
ncbi:MAG: hypothetical protein PF904_17715 [Kiritimatiellae bacterium]|nr:hypothetical protein [Kiritimatiellia bacterium]